VHVVHPRILEIENQVGYCGLKEPLICMWIISKISIAMSLFNPVLGVFLKKNLWLCRIVGRQ
jgi:hypothetical protein